MSFFYTNYVRHCPSCLLCNTMSRVSELCYEKASFLFPFFLPFFTIYVMLISLKMTMTNSTELHTLYWIASLALLSLSQVCEIKGKSSLLPLCSLSITDVMINFSLLLHIKLIIMSVLNSQQTLLTGLKSNLIIVIAQSIKHLHLAKN